MKKYITIFMSLFLLLVCTYAIAEENTPITFNEGDFQYALLDDGTIEIIKYRGNAKNLVIPSQVYGFDITHIAESAFSFCDSLTTIEIPNSIISIGNEAFKYCDNLTTVSIPYSVKIIDSNPFTFCYELKTITVSPDNPYFATIDGVLFSKPDRRLICYPKGFTERSYTIPVGIQIIGDNAFEACSLTNIIIPDSVISIGNNAFGICDFKSIIIPDSVTSIGDDAFYSCNNLTSITIPRNVQTIISNPFTSCNHLNSISVSPDNPYFEMNQGVLISKPDNRLVCYPCAFTKPSYSIPDGVQAIGEHAFAYCYALTSITIPSTVTSIERFAFCDCSNLSLLTFQIVSTPLEIMPSLIARI